MDASTSNNATELGQVLSPRVQLGNQLKKAREKRGLSHEDVASHIRIRPVLLKALEEGQYGQFSSVIYIKGFIKTYASFLGVPFEPLFALYELEPHEKKVVKVFEITESSLPQKNLGRKLAIVLSFCAILLAVVSLDFSKLSREEQLFEPPKFPDTQKNDVLETQVLNPLSEASVLDAKPVALGEALTSFGDQKLYLIELPKTNNPIVRPEKITIIPEKEGWIELYNGETLLLRAHLKQDQSYFLPKTDATMLLIKEGNWLKLITPEKEMKVQKSVNCDDFYCEFYE